MNKEHGSPFDRGRADSYYHRPPRPHYYPVKREANGLANLREIGNRVTDLTDEQKKEYVAGYNSMDDGDKKEWD